MIEFIKTIITPYRSEYSVFIDVTYRAVASIKSYSLNVLIFQTKPHLAQFVSHVL